MTTLALDANTIRAAAYGLWRCTIYPALGIAVGHGKHMACPHCGGRDRFRCDDLAGRGTFFCNQCGAGDGFALVMRVFGCDFPEALRRVADTLGARSSSTHLLALSPPRPPRMDLRQMALELELHAIALQERAEKTLQMASGLDCISWSSDDWDMAWDAVGRAFDDREHAERLFDVADRLREQAFAERLAEQERKETR